MYLKRGILIIILIFMLVISTSLVSKISSDKPVLSTTLYVGGSGSGNYTRIQDAINDSITGGTVFVYDDSSPYFENLILNNPVSLLGENKDTTIIDGNGGTYCINIISDGNILSGFTIQNCSGTDATGIYIDAADTTISNNIIKNNDQYGIYITSSSSNTVIYHNNFISNTNNAYDECDSSIWDNGYPSGGNYWDDQNTPDNNHSFYQNLTGFDLLVDNPYIINGVNNSDRWPWVIQNGWEHPLFIPDIILVQFNDNVTDIQIATTIDNYGTKLEIYLNHIQVHILSINVTNQSEFDTMYLFDNDPLVNWTNVDVYNYFRGHLTEPNDECYPKQWHLNNYGNNPSIPTGLIDADIDAPQAWEHITDCRQDIYNNDFVIAIIDSGVDLHHPDIINNLWVNPSEVVGNMAFNGLDDDGDGFIDIMDPDFDGDQDIFSNDDDGNGIIDDIHGADFSNITNPDGSPDDEDGHGTHCAGIICAQGNNVIGVSGVCWRAQLMVLKGDIARSIHYILDKKAEGININVTSFSQGIATDDIVRDGFTVAAANNWLQNNILPFYQNVINQLNNADILFVCSVGNDGKNVDAANYIDLPPEAPNPNIISVGASDNQDKLAIFSNWGQTSVDLIAPGENIMSLAMHGRYIYNDSDNSDQVTQGDQRLITIPAIFPSGSTVEAGDGDINYPLRDFNGNEKHIGSDNTYDDGEHIYRDNDGEDNVTGGDRRLSHVHINGILQYFHNTIVVNTDSDNGTDLINFQANERHRDNEGNFFFYDPGEYIYRDVDNSWQVSVGDIRLSQIHSTRSENTNVQISQSDVGDCLHNFNANEKHDETVNANNRYDPGEMIYRDNDDPPDNEVSIGDQRLTTLDNDHKAGSFVLSNRSPDFGRALIPFLNSEKYSLVEYMSGASMAAPMVAGSVSHFWCHYPWLTHIQVKDWILRKVDPEKTLNHAVISGKWNDGRLRMISGFDFGDAPDPYAVPGQYPTVLWDELSHGASHEDMGEEWLGWDTSPEYDANVNWPWDVDAATGTPNLLPARDPTDPHPSYNGSSVPNLDWYEDGVSIPMIVFKGGTYEIKFNIRTENPFIHDVDDGRYDEYRLPIRDEKKIYINAYFDWNNDGDWDDGGEHLIKCPAKQCTWWGGPFMHCCYGIFWPMPFDNAYRKTTFTVPDDANDTIWVRVRLDYGENVGRNPWPLYESTHPFDAVGEILSHTYAHAQFGEVEDYLMYTAVKLKLIGYPEYINDDISYVTSETPFELIDIPEEFTPLIYNYYRLWYEDEWSEWIEYSEDEMFYLFGEGPHQIEFYGTTTESKTILNETFKQGDDLWTIENLADYGNTWEWSDELPYWADQTINTPCMIINDNNSELSTTGSLTSPLLRFDQFSNNILQFMGQFSAVGQEKVYVNISTDYGDTWTNVFIITQEVPTQFSSWSVDLSDIVGDSMFLVQFTYTDENELGNGMIITDVILTGDLITYSPTYYNYHIVDNSPPIIENIVDEPIIKTNQIPVTISCDVTDQYCGVNSVKCNISGPEGFDQINISMTDRNYAYTDLFTIPGTYTYFIWANDSLYHNIMSDTVTFQVFAPPTANFTYNPLTPKINEMIQFNDTSTDIDGTIINWTWNFSDGNMSYEQNPSHSYNIPGNYSVCLTVTDNDNILNMTCKIISITLPDEVLDVNQSVFNRGFPIRHAPDGDWGAGQNFIPTVNTITKCEMYLRKFGSPEFNLTIELREDAIDGPVLDILTFTPSEIQSSWTWLELDFNDVTVTPGIDYFIKCPPAPSGVTTSFGYEWGYAFGNQYDDGAFWFTRDGGNLWRDLPTMYEFVFRTYGYS